MSEQVPESLDYSVAALARELVVEAETLDYKGVEVERLEATQFVTRALIHGVLNISAAELECLTREPAYMGRPRWDALLQGLVAWRCQTNDPPVIEPAWVDRTRLEAAWAPFGGSIRDDGWYTMAILSTPVALLHRGIVMNRYNLREL